MVHHAAVLRLLLLIAASTALLDPMTDVPLNRKRRIDPAARHRRAGMQSGSGTEPDQWDWAQASAQALTETVDHPKPLTCLERVVNRL